MNVITITRLIEQMAEPMEAEHCTLDEKVFDIASDSVLVSSFSALNRKMAGHKDKGQVLSMLPSKDDSNELKIPAPSPANAKRKLIHKSGNSNVNVKRCKLDVTPTIHHFDPDDKDLSQRRSFIRTITACSIHRTIEVWFFKQFKHWPCYENKRHVTLLNSFYNKYRMQASKKEKKPRLKENKSKSKIRRMKKETNQVELVDESQKVTAIKSAMIKEKGGAKHTMLSTNNVEEQKMDQNCGSVDDHSGIKGNRSHMIFHLPKNAASQLEKLSKESNYGNEMKLVKNYCCDKDSCKTKQMIRCAQQQLLLLNHSFQCRVEGSCATNQQCVDTKKLWSHLCAPCKDSQCTFPRCLSSRAILGHFHHCKCPTCPLCEPVRGQVSKSFPHISPLLCQPRPTPHTKVNTATKNKNKREGKITKLKKFLEMSEGCSQEEFIKRIEEVLHTRYGFFWPDVPQTTSSTVERNEGRTTCNSFY